MPVRKRFGQHFLHDPGVIRRIIDAVAPVAGERIVEIGPGRGALTWDLLRRAHSLDVIEIDRDLAQSLRLDARGAGGLRVHVENALETDFEGLRAAGAPLRIVGNLPYNISTPLLFHLLSQRAALHDMHFMLQKEVVERMTAQPANKTYGRLTVMLAAVAEVEHLVKPGNINPDHIITPGIFVQRMIHVPNAVKYIEQRTVRKRTIADAPAGTGGDV